MTIRFHSFTGLGALFLATTVGCSSPQTITAADDGHATPSSSHASMSAEEAMERMTEMAAPGAAHAALMARAGTWVVDSKYRMSPDAEWIVGRATVTAKPVLGGRYLLEEHDMEMLGTPMSGFLFLGFDNLTQEYTSLWMDTTSTWWVEARGTRGADGVTNMSGTMKDIAGTRPYRMKFWSKGDGAMEQEMYDTIDGREVLVMTYSSRRKS